MLELGVVLLERQMSSARRPLAGSKWWMLPALSCASAAAYSVTIGVSIVVDQGGVLVLVVRVALEVKPTDGVYLSSVERPGADHVAAEVEAAVGLLGDDHDVAGGCRRPARSRGSRPRGSLSLIDDRRASVAVTLSTGACGLAALATSAAAGRSAAKRFQLKMTSCASTARPLTGALLCHLTPGAA